MHELAELTVRTESGQVVGAQYTTNMTMTTVRTVPTESPVVPRAILNLALRIDVQEGTLLVVASVEPRVEVAFGHLGHVVFVQEFALVALLAETTKPVLADDCAIAANVSKRAGCSLFAFHTVAAVEKLANSCG